MNFYAQNKDQVIKTLKTDANYGLSREQISKNQTTYGENVISRKKKKGFIKRFFSALLEPMMLILCFSLVVATGSSIGQFIKSGQADFSESLGILGAILLSVFITLIMEGSSEKAFSALNKIYDNTSVKVIRGGEVIFISRALLTVGDIVLIESGDKIVADGRLLESNQLYLNESSLTGESNPVEKHSSSVLKEGTPLAERENFLYSGTFVTSGNGKMVVTAVGDSTEMGKIAKDLKEKKSMPSPLDQKLSRLGKLITGIGFLVALIVFIVSIVRLAVLGEVNFNSVQSLFIESVILIVAAVPEGLPTIVAVSLALNMIKLAKENALIRKMVASETAGAVSVICSDKTGTLTQNKMKVESICLGKSCYALNENLSEYILENIICNSTAKVMEEKGKRKYYGNGTECALLECLYSINKGSACQSYKKAYKPIEREPFSSKIKYMSTVIEVNGVRRKLYKGAPEKVLALCSLTSEKRKEIEIEIEKEQKRARRIIAFAHQDLGENSECVFDGYASIVDPVRKEVKKAIEECKRAKIKVKMLTGDNILTAQAIARELDILESESQVVSAVDLEKLDDNALKKALQKITVIARSTPSLKLRVVKALKEMGEVVAVTGDGINDAPAIRHADVGIAMGKSGSEITKEASDIVLLDDSFSTVVKAIAFGRNVYKNLQRFILFQLSVNLSSLLFITISVLMGRESPFNTFQLLWINVIMDGPPALTLGMERVDKTLMSSKPVKRTDSIVSRTMLVRIIFNALFIGGVLILQELTNFLGANFGERKTAIFTLFVLFQLFNAFNSKELGAKSILGSIGKNKVMLFSFIGVFLVQVIMSQFFPFVFGGEKMRFVLWVRIILTASLIVVLSEIGKLVYSVLREKLNGFLTFRRKGVKNARVVNKNSRRA